MKSSCLGKQNSTTNNNTLGNPRQNYNIYDAHFRNKDEKLKMNEIFKKEKPPGTTAIDKRLLMFQSAFHANRR